MKHFIILVAALFSLASCTNNSPIGEIPYQLPPEIEEVPFGTQYGLRAVEIELPDTEGDKKALSTLHGKLVLVDFWASWCPPCRKENPELVKLYEKYKDTEFVNGLGFTIYSVSLDRSKEAWLQAIEDDQLPWPIHISDLTGARMKAAISYGVQAIPSNFLLDQNGVIIGVKMRGEKLAETIAELVAE